ncbi:hypothetical protein F5878DRAFT_644116 [Lentinula raphanica]|uniref:Uncharacterized protein n=1 Tax=Lentinula raphanica TaxID=153919 RepID=A0AA38UF14_9AGAR|nr:hypothetical protein F5878DRAFT_644116 [Lentinula raphanica]
MFKGINEQQLYHTTPHQHRWPMSTRRDGGTDAAEEESFTCQLNCGCEHSVGGWKRARKGGVGRGRQGEERRMSHLSTTSTMPKPKPMARPVPIVSDPERSPIPPPPQPDIVYTPGEEGLVDFPIESQLQLKDIIGNRRSREPSTAYHSIHLIGEHLIRSQFNPDPNPPSLPPHPSNLNPLSRLDHVPGPHLKFSPGASEGSTHMPSIVSTHRFLNPVLLFFSTLNVQRQPFYVLREATWREQEDIDGSFGLETTVHNNAREEVFILLGLLEDSFNILRTRSIYKHKDITGSWSFHIPFLLNRRASFRGQVVREWDGDAWDGYEEEGASEETEGSYIYNYTHYYRVRTSSCASASQLNGVGGEVAKITV